MTDVQESAATLVLWMIIVGLVVFGVIGSLVMRWMEGSGDSSVKQSATVPAPRPNPRELRSDAVEPPTELPELRGSEPLDIGSEPVYVTKEELARSLALVVIIDDDGRRLSQDIISRAAGMSKERAGQLVREMRGQPDPDPPLVNPLRVRDQAGERLIPR